MPHILITDDDPHLRRLVRTYAELEGFECTEAGDGAAAVTALKQSAFDLVLLDVMMPGPDGFETLEAIRGFSQVPVIMLTARNEEYDKLNGFRLGVDDYVAKPFSPKELMARIGAVLRRTQVRTTAPVTKELAFGGLSIFPDSRIVTLDEKKISLPPKEFDLLYKLLSYPRRTFSRAQLMDEFWSGETSASLRAVDVYITRIREKFSGCEDFKIVTVHGLGYKAVQNA